MQYINKPMRAKVVYLKGNNRPMWDKVVLISGSFLIVADDENSTDATLYNLDTVDRIVGIKEIQETTAKPIEEPRTVNRSPWV